MNLEIEVEEICMKLEERIVPVNNKLLSDYWAGSEYLQSFYEYTLSNQSFRDRAEYLNTKKQNTKQLSEIIRSYMVPLGITEKVEENLKALETGAFAIVGGQQAGVLTGPLYSVHKAITVIKLAKEQSEKLNTKVVPIFWIAGEDHDLHEINHTFTTVNGEVKKRIFPTRNAKTMASYTPFNKEEMKDFVKGIFQDYGETSYSFDLIQSINKEIDESETFTQFFSRLFNGFFKEEGLLLIDAAYTPFRQLESGFFKKLIEQNDEIAQVVYEKESLFEKLGYGTPINAVRENANLFYVKNGERILLERKDDLFVSNQYHLQFTKEELLDIAENHPELLSNNVVTRPLMQEMTIPVLAFVAGPGELAYWGLLKDAFRAVGLQMPILVPRLNITLLSKKTENLMEDYDLTFEKVIDKETEKVRADFIESVQDKEAQEKIEQLRTLFVEKYKDLEEYLKEEQFNLEDILEKNLQYHERQFQYLKKKIEDQVLLKHDKVLRQLSKIENEIIPNGILQERLFNPYQFINEYGPDFIHNLIQLPFEISQAHKIVRV